MNGLSDAEKREILRCVKWGLPIPHHFHSLIFPDLERLFNESAPKSSFYAHLRVCFDSEVQWENLLIHGDNLEALSLLSQHFKPRLDEVGGIKLIYIDPPFDVGSNFMMNIKVGSSETPFEQMAYSDKWGLGKDSFMAMMAPRLELMVDALEEGGSIVVHCDWRTNTLFRLCLDRILGKSCFQNEIIWHYTGGGRAKNHFSRKHDTILWYTKGSGHTFNIDAIRVPYNRNSGYAKSGIRSKTGKVYHPNPKGTPVDDVWNIPIINPCAHERVGYPTQKPKKLLKRIIDALTDEGDLVVDFFCGSGSTLAVADELGRKWIGVDQGSLAIQTAFNRLSSQSQQPLMVGACSTDGEPKAQWFKFNVRPLSGLSTKPSKFEVLFTGFCPDVTKLDTKKHTVIDGLLNSITVNKEGSQSVPMMTDWTDWIDSYFVSSLSEDGELGLVLKHQKNLNDGLGQLSLEFVLTKKIRAIRLTLIDIFGQFHSCEFNLEDAMKAQDV